MQGPYLRKYGVETTVDFHLYQTSGTELKVDAAHASGDTKVMKDEGDEANSTNGFTDEGQGYSIVLTATEMQAARIVIHVVDQGTKAWIDTSIIIETYGHASAMHAVDLDDGVRAGLTALPAAAADAAGGLPISDAGGLDLDTKLANTNEVTAARMGALTDWINGGRLDLLLDAILEDTGELQTDWVNGGRLDLLIDAIKAKTDNLPALPAATGDIPTTAQIADAVWDEDVDTSHQTAGTAGKKLDDAGGAADPWSTALPGAYGAGTAGKIIGDNINATIGSRASQTSVDTIDDLLDTEVAAILADTNELQTDLVNGGRLDLLIDAIKAKTDNLPTDPADQSAVEAAITAATSPLATAAALDAVDNFVDTEIAAIITHLTDIKGGTWTNETLVAIKAYVDDLETRLTAARAGYLDNLSAGAAALEATAQTLLTESQSHPTLAEIEASLVLAKEATLTTIVGYLDTEIAAILADTNELQGDWANGGRLDLLIDAIKAVTDAIGATGTGLSAVPWNAAWDAEVQSEVFDALDAAFTDATGLTANGLLDRIRTLMWILRNKLEVTDANGNTVIYKDDSTTPAFSVAGALTDDSTTTTRLRIA